MTIAHELGHYVLHPGCKRRFHYHWLLRENRWRFSRKLRRLVGKAFTQEDEAYLWAMILLLQIGATKELIGHLEAHPENKKLFYLALSGLAISTARTAPYLWLKVLFGVDITP